MQRLRYLRKDMRNNWDLYLLAIPLVVYYVIFCYGPMYGLKIAFMDYNPWKGMEGSTYAGLKHFRNFLSLSTSFDYIINTLRISLCSLIFSYPLPILLALMFNAVPAKRFRKSLPECDADILYGVVIVHLRIALTGNGKVKAAVCGKKRQHVVQKPAAGIDLGFSRAFKRKRKADVRFFCGAVYRCGAHAASPFRMSSMAAKSTSICSGVPMVMRTYSEMRGFLKCRTSTPCAFRVL